MFRKYKLYWSVRITFYDSLTFENDKCWCQMNKKLIKMCKNDISKIGPQNDTT